MTRMMAAMDIRPTGDVDRDFVGMVEPHHQGAIDVAILELRHGRNEQLRRLAQEIIVDQQQEIVAMRLAIGKTLPARAPSPDQPPPLYRARRRSTAWGSRLTGEPWRWCRSAPTAAASIDTDTNRS